MSFLCVTNCYNAITSSLECEALKPVSLVNVTGLYVGNFFMYGLLRRLPGLLIQQSLGVRDQIAYV